MKVRESTIDDEAAIAALNTLAFGSTAEAEILRRLKRDNDDLISLVKCKGVDVIGHIQFYKITSPDQEFIGLGPISVHPDFQRKGHGSELIRKGLLAVKAKSLTPLVFVQGHTGFYPKFGFSSARAAQFKAPWDGDAFMALELRTPAPRSGVLDFPKAFL